MVKLMLKLVVLPLIAIVTLIQWLAIFFTGFTAVIFNLFSGLMFLVAVGSFVMGLEKGSEALKMLALSFGIFIIPHIAEWCIMRIASLNYCLRDFISS